MLSYRHEIKTGVSWRTIPSSMHDNKIEMITRVSAVRFTLMATIFETTIN